MRILFMGTPEIALPFFYILRKEKYNICGVVTQPDKPKGRKHVISSSLLKKPAITYQLPLFTPQSIKKDPIFINKIKNHIKPDLVVVVAFGQILPVSFLEIPHLGCINVHFSLLPKYRGAEPIAWAIINGESQTGISTMYINEKMDEGDIIYQQIVSIKPDDTRLILENKLANIGTQVLIKTIKDIENKIAIRVPQNHQQASYAPKLKSEDALIDWKESAQNIHNRIRGLYPDPGAYSFYKNRRIKFIESLPQPELKLNYIYPSGTVVTLSKDNGMGISTGKGIIFIKLLQPESKRIISFQDFYNGYRVKIGDNFHSNFIKDSLS